MSPSPLRTVELPHGQRIVVRHATASDIPAIGDLYRRLSFEDTYRRFFTAFRADERFVAGLVGFGVHGGGCLVAELSSASGGASLIVAEADFEPVADGNAEFSIIVDPEWRGWLAPYLLDALAEAAATRGIPNLQADILAVNRPMLALIKRRGYAVINADDYQVVRVRIGTATRMPTWPPRREEPRVLVEAPGGRWHATLAAEDAGFEVVVCPGPSRTGDQTCPLLRGERCPLVDDADVLVYALPEGDDRDSVLLEAHRRHHGGRPMLVEVRRPVKRRRDLPVGAVELTAPTSHEIVAALRGVLGDADQPRVTGGSGAVATETSTSPSAS